MGCDNPIIRNEHLANFVNTLNTIKVKIGMYTIVTGLKSDWLQYANHNSIHQELILAPDKKTINPTIESFLNDQWFKSWDDLAGHAQTKYWLPRPDSFSATKLLKMSRKHLGFNIQFFSGHGWWRKHLMTAKLRCGVCRHEEKTQHEEDCQEEGSGFRDLQPLSSSSSGRDLEALQASNCGNKPPEW